MRSSSQAPCQPSPLGMAWKPRHDPVHNSCLKNRRKRVNETSLRSDATVAARRVSGSVPHILATVIPSLYATVQDTTSPTRRR